MQGFLKIFFKIVNFLFFFIFEVSPERYYNGTTIVLQRYYNGITFLLVELLKDGESGRVEFSGNFTYENLDFGSCRE
jgi:hypothetical protein